MKYRTIRSSVQDMTSQEKQIAWAIAQSIGQNEIAHLDFDGDSAEALAAVEVARQPNEEVGDTMIDARTVDVWGRDWRLAIHVARP